MGLLGRILYCVTATVVVAYLAISTFIAAPYYNYQYAQRHGFVDWLIFGEVVATIKAYAWPLDYLFPSVLQPMRSAIAYHNQVADIIRGETPSEPDFQRALSLERLALTEAKRADIAKMNEKVPGLGDHFRDEFIAGVATIIEGVEAHDPELVSAGERMVKNFADWRRAASKNNVN